MEAYSKIQAVLTWRAIALDTDGRLLKNPTPRRQDNSFGGCVTLVNSFWYTKCSH
uniref:Uncharacterized protein n=1 Tax=Helianthus annuus TaxID=4232 RepID=A0A251UH41_HELAN